MSWLAQAPIFVRPAKKRLSGALRLLISVLITTQPASDGIEMRDGDLQGRRLLQGFWKSVVGRVGGLGSVCWPQEHPFEGEKKSGEPLPSACMGFCFLSAGRSKRPSYMVRNRYCDFEGKMQKFSIFIALKTIPFLAKLKISVWRRCL